MRNTTDRMAEPNANEVESLFAQAIDLPIGIERSQFLQRATANNGDLLRAVERLLKIHDSAGNFLEVSAFSREYSLFAVEGLSGSKKDDSVIDTVLAMLAPANGLEAMGQLGRFTITSVVGRGGSGVVFKATDSKLHRDVAIKVLAPSLAKDPKAAGRFLQEARAMAAIRHENVVSIYEVCDDFELPYFVMEFMPEGSLHERLRAHGPLRFEEALMIGRQVAAGLAAAHAKGLLHRDIKPSNILLDGSGSRIKLVDFGLAGTIHEGDTDRIAGTPQYASPEQLRGESLDARSDLFSLGCLLYALVTGNSPFASPSRLDIVRRTMNEGPIPVRKAFPKIPIAFDNLVMALLEKDRANRPESIGDVIQVLESIKSNRLFLSRRLALVMASAIALFVLLWAVANPFRSRQLPKNILSVGKAKHSFNVLDSELAPFLLEQVNVELVHNEYEKPLSYWSAKTPSQWGHVTYRFRFDQPWVQSRIS